MTSPSTASAAITTTPIRCGRSCIPAPPPTPRSFGFASKRIDNLLEDGRAETDTAKREAIYKDLAKAYFEEVPQVPLNWRVQAFALDDRVTGFISFPGWLNSLLGLFARRYRPGLRPDAPLPPPAPADGAGHALGGRHHRLLGAVPGAGRSGGTAAHDRRRTGEPGGDPESAGEDGARPGRCPRNTRASSPTPRGSTSAAR